MQIVGIFSEMGFSLEVFDLAGFSLEYEEYGNKERYSDVVVDPESPEALTLAQIEQICEELAHEKALSLGVSSSGITIEEES